MIKVYFLFSFMAVFASYKVTAKDYSEQEQQAINIVNQQLEAYNSQDIDEFVATYHPDIEIYNFPGERKYKGKESLRKAYQGMFARLKCLKATSKKRIVLKNMVIDHELAQMCYESSSVVDKSIEVLAIYEVEDGLIRRVVFQR